MIWAFLIGVLVGSFIVIFMVYLYGRKIEKEEDKEDPIL